MKTVLPFFISFLMQLLALRFFSRHSLCVDHALSGKPQGFHTVATPRSGGLGIFVGTLMILAIDRFDGLIFVLSALPAFVVGFAEDLSSSVGPLKRLAFIAGGALFGTVFMDAVITDLGFFTLPLAVALPFTIFAVTGVANALNIVDGMNGLASGFAIITLFFIALGAYVFGDQLILGISAALIAAIVGFFVLNFPAGRIFLGDGGAYFIGFALAELSVLLVNRNPGISPWYPLALMIYPVTEVAFSIFRRKFRRGSSPFVADRGHLHSLIFKRVTKSNHRTSYVFWALAALFDVVAFTLRGSSVAMAGVIVSFVVLYLAIYSRIVRFKGPWLLRQAARVEETDYVKDAGEVEEAEGQGLLQTKIGGGQ